MNVIRIVFKYYDYSIARQKGSLLLSFGLLNAKSTIIKPEGSDYNDKKELFPKEKWGS